MSYEHLKTAGLDSLESQLGLYGQDLEDFLGLMKGESEPSAQTDTLEADQALSTATNLGQAAVNASYDSARA
jgi:hypothetical protein